MNRAGQGRPVSCFPLNHAFHLDLTLTSPSQHGSSTKTLRRVAQIPKSLSIFSVHARPDGSRIAPGGLGAKVCIWSAKPILNPASEETGKPPKSLRTLFMHNGPVLTVRWAHPHSGRWLASGSDDEFIVVWDLDLYVVCNHGSRACSHCICMSEIHEEGFVALMK